MGNYGVRAWQVPKAYGYNVVLPESITFKNFDNAPGTYTLPIDAYQKQRVKWATIGIQEQLIRRAYLARPAAKLDGVFGGKTEAAVKKFQHDASLPVTGLVNQATSIRLFAPLFIWWQAAVEIPDNLLFGLARLESACDPGAEGGRNSHDRGIFQYNRDAHPEITDEIAYSKPDWCIQRGAYDLVIHYAKIISLPGLEQSLPYETLWNAALASHNNPTLGKAWALAGEPTTEQIAKYVTAVRKNAALPI